MPLFQRRSFDDGRGLVAIWHITEEGEELMAPLPRGVEMLAEARHRFKAASRRLEWLAVRRLLHEVGCLSPIAYHSSGRPYLMDDHRHISISHTRGYAAVALHTESPVGLDIEQRTEKVLRVRDKFLSHEEKLFLPSEKKNVEAMLVIWTAKEAMFKLVDKPGIDFADHFHVAPFTMAEADTLTACETFTENQASFQLSYRIYPDFVMCLSSSL